MPNPVLRGDLDAGRACLTSTAHNEQKITHRLILEALLHELEQQDLGVDSVPRARSARSRYAIRAHSPA